MVKDKTYLICIIIGLVLIFLEMGRMKKPSFPTDLPLGGNKAKYGVNKDNEVKMKSENALKELHRRRIKQLRFHCFNKRDSLNLSKKINVRLHFAHNHNLAVCKIPKIGSTFLMQLFLSLNKSALQSQNFGKARVVLHIISDDLLESYDKTDENDRVFLVSRDPYTRLYSAYIDKMFLPAMNSYSSKIAKANNKTKGKETTFEEFLREVTSDALNGNLLDRHWNPVYNSCEPCIIPYDIVAKQESYSQDIEYILSQLNITEEFRTFIVAALHTHRTNNSIKEITKVMFSHAKNPRGVIEFGHSFIEFCERLWESYKIQGYIRSNIRFPEERFSSLNYSSLNEALDAYLYYATISNMTHSQSKQQRYNYLSAAYKNVSQATISKIQKAYSLDFILFGYEMEPPVHSLNV